MASALVVAADDGDDFDSGQQPHPIPYLTNAAHVFTEEIRRRGFEWSYEIRNQSSNIFLSDFQKYVETR